MELDPLYDIGNGEFYSSSDFFDYSKKSISCIISNFETMGVSKEKLLQSLKMFFDNTSSNNIDLELTIIGNDGEDEVFYEGGMSMINIR